MENCCASKFMRFSINLVLRFAESHVVFPGKIFYGKYFFCLTMFMFFYISDSVEQFYLITVEKDVYASRIMLSNQYIYVK